MATRTFLTPAQSTAALELLRSQSATEVSHYVEACLEELFRQHPAWPFVRPVQLGSWSRDELCAKSDIDLFFFGDEAKVLQFVQDIAKQGIKIRYRMPQDPADWTVGVEAFDVLALLRARPFFPEDAVALETQIRKIQERGLKYRKQLFRTMLQERRQRAQRYDSIANYLEPNLKYGAGGLRDLEQGLMIDQLFPHMQIFNAPAREHLQKSKAFFLKIRHFLHLHGAGDILVGALQAECAQRLGFADAKTFMSHVERDIADVSFFADVIAERARASRRQNALIAETKISSFEDALRVLQKSSSALMQARVREAELQVRQRKSLGLLFEKYFNSKSSDEFVRALFRSNLLQKLVPALARLQGHVQHDQYHRYSVDAHTLQAMREVLRVRQHPRLLGRLARIARELTTQDWDLLLWTALYHDLGKGLKGDHSTLGADLAKRDLVALGVSLQRTAQVVWMVQSHLLLSGAAFRQNPHASSTWTELFKRGVKGRRILWLTLFTAIDIRATNPEAWNDWKERLLDELAKTLQSPQASHLNLFLEYAQKKKRKVSADVLAKLDPVLFESVPHPVLLADILALSKAKGDLPPLILRNRRREVWVRFHCRQDRPGLFLAFVQRLAYAGLSVQEAFVQTYPMCGAYDWFKIKSSQNLSVMKRLLGVDTFVEAQLPDVEFAKIELISQDDRVAIVSFRGRDQKGALLSAAKKLHQAEFEIVSAKVHTWGRQIEDVFTVKYTPQIAEKMRVLQKTIS